LDNYNYNYNGKKKESNDSICIKKSITPNSKFSKDLKNFNFINKAFTVKNSLKSRNNNIKIQESIPSSVLEKINKLRKIDLLNSKTNITNNINNNNGYGNISNIFNNNFFNNNTCNKNNKNKLKSLVEKSNFQKYMSIVIKL